MRPFKRRKRSSLGDVLAVGQGAYFAVTGIWPILHIKSFEAITGSKKEKWLVKTVGGLIVCIGGTMLVDGLKKRTNASTAGLAVSSSAFLAGVDVWYVLKNRISPIYLLDAVAEVGLVAAWATIGRTK